jgi:hypothetical protein
MASSTKNPVENRVHPKAHELSACVRKLRSPANKAKKNKHGRTSATTLKAMDIGSSKPGKSKEENPN